MDTCASSGPVFSKHTVSWLVICGCGPVLVGGIYPSAIAHRFFPIAIINQLMCKSSAYSGLIPRQPVREQARKRWNFCPAVDKLSNNFQPAGSITLGKPPSF